MAKPAKIAALEILACDMVGDGKAPDLFFVTDQGVVITVTRNKSVAYDEWRNLAARRPMVESAMESRRFGVIASVEPESDKPGARLIVIDELSRA